MSDSDFSSAFDRSFAMHQAISAAVAEADGSGHPVVLFDVARHLQIQPRSLTAELVADIIKAAEEVGTSIVASELRE